MIVSWYRQIFIFIFISGVIVVVGIDTEIKTLFASLFFPIFLFAILALREMRFDMEITHNLPTRAAVGDELELKIHVKITRGMGMINLDLPTFREMELLEGSNVHIIYKGKKIEEREYTYKVRTTRRGIFPYSDIEIEYSPILGRNNYKRLTQKVESSIIVVPPVKILKKSQFQIRSRLVKPRYAVTRLGPPTNEFERIREFVSGDSFKSINWKSTARVSYNNKIMVNQYEREGLKNFIFLLDTSNPMSRGVSYENPFEYSISLILSGANYLASKNYNVGYWPLCETVLKPLEYVMPSSGGDVVNRIRDKLLRVEYRRTLQKGYLLDPVLTRIIMETQPQITLITSLNARNREQIMNTYSRLLKLGAGVVLVNILAESIVAKRIEPRIIGIFTGKGKDITNTPKSTVTWDPVTQNLGKTAYEIAIRGGW